MAGARPSAGEAADQRRTKNADNDCAANLTRRQGGDHYECRDTCHWLEAGQLTKADQGRRVIHHDARILERDEAKKQADTSGHTEF